MRSSDIGSATTRLALACGLSLAGTLSAFAQPAVSAQGVLPSATVRSAAQKIAALKAANAPGSPALSPEAIGSSTIDLVYTPVTPCRIVDSRLAQGALQASTTRSYDVDNPSSFSSQGGYNGTCGIPYGISYAVAMTITAVQPVGPGYMIAWGLGAQPNTSVLNFTAGQDVANTTIIPVVPGAGNDFSVWSSVNSNIVIDVVGYFAPPVATALDCTSVSSGPVSVPYNAYTNVDAMCPAGYTVTGGGTFPTEGTQGRPNIWTDGSPISGGWRTWVDNQTGSSRTIATYAQCCRVPGR